MTNVPSKHDVDQLIDELIEREGGGLLGSPRRSRRANRFGVTEAVARAHGFTGPISLLRGARRRPSIAGFTGFVPAMTRSPAAPQGLPPSCSIPASTWVRASPPPSSNER
jgi:hypothetical protein